MKIFDVIRMAFKNLFRSKVRTILTILGIVIGTTAIIIMLSLGIAINETYKEQMKWMGDMNVITVSPNYEKFYSNRKRKDEWVEPYISKAEIEQIAEIPNVEAVTPFYETSVKMQIGKYIGYVNIVGIEPEAMEALNYKVSEGRLLAPGDTNQIVFGFDMKYQFYNPKDRNWWYNSEPPDINFLEDKINMTFDTSYGDIYPGSSKKKPKLYKVEGVGILAEGSWETAYRAFMNIDELLKLQEEYNKKNNTDSGTKSNRRKNTEIGYSQVKVKVNEIKNVLDVQEKINEIGLNAYSNVESLEQANKTSRLCRGFLAV